MSIEGANWSVSSAPAATTRSGTDRPRHATDDDFLAQTVAQRRHQPDEILVPGEEEEGFDIRSCQRGIDHVDDEVESARDWIFSRPFPSDVRFAG